MIHPLRTVAGHARQLALTAEGWYELARAARLLRSNRPLAGLLRDALRFPEGGRPLTETSELVRAVARAAGHHVKPMHCLERSLAALWMLRRRHFAVRLRLGCRRGESDVEFHAWLEDAAGAVVVGTGLEGTFVPLGGVP